MSRAAALLGLAACSGGGDDPSLHTAPTGDTGAPACVGRPALGAVRVTCDGGAWSGLAPVEGGCPVRVALDAWEPSLRHERHPFEARGEPPAVTFSLGPLPAPVDPADWSPGVASALACDAPDLTFVVSVGDADGVSDCVAWGPRAADVAALPGATAGLVGCRAP